MAVRAFTLLELTTALTLGLLLLAAGYPRLAAGLAQSRFRRDAQAFGAHLREARRLAQLGEQSVVFRPDGDGRGYTLQVDGPDGPRVLRRVRTHAPGTGLVLPAPAPRHPTRGDPLTQALRSTHGEEVVFARRGSSSATLVFSDGGRQALCAVVASGSGTIRLFAYRAPHWTRVF